MDLAAAIARIDQTLEDIRTYDEVLTLLGYGEGNARAVSADQAVQEGIAIAREIAVADPRHVHLNQLSPTYRTLNSERWAGATHALRTLRAGLVTAAEAQAIVGPRGPALRAASLHPAVWNAALLLWSDGHYRAAVQAAATALELMAAAKLGVSLQGRDLFRQAFSTDAPRPDRPRLRFDVPPDEEQRWESQHSGARDLGAGAMALIRNETTHRLDELDPAVALEYLAVLSVMARSVERATVERA